MGEEPTAAEKLEATRQAIDAQRAELQRTSDQLRDVFDLRKRVQENPALFIGIGAGALFLLANGPVRVVRLVRRRVVRTDPDEAYNSLPKPMRAWVDHMTGALGLGAAEARRTMSEELLAWRHDPRKHGKVSKKLAQQIAEGPPGPRRVVWSAFEAGAAILTAAVARKVVQRFISSEPPSEVEALDALGTAGGASEPDPKRAKDDVTRSKAERAGAARSEYSAMSSSRVP